MLEIGRNSTVVSTVCLSGKKKQLMKLQITGRKKNMDTSSSATLVPAPTFAIERNERSLKFFVVFWTVITMGTLFTTMAFKSLSVPRSSEEKLEA